MNTILIRKTNILKIKGHFNMIVYTEVSQMQFFPHRRCTGGWGCLTAALVGTVAAAAEAQGGAVARVRWKEPVFSSLRSSVGDGYGSIMRDSWAANVMADFFIFQLFF